MTDKEYSLLIYRQNELTLCLSFALQALIGAEPFIADHVAMTPYDGPSDRIALDMCQEAIRMIHELGINGGEQK